MYNDLVTFIGCVNVVIHHNADSQGDRGQTKYLWGGRELTPIEHLPGCWALCFHVTHEAMGPSCEAGAPGSLHLQDRELMLKNIWKKKIISLEAPQHVSSGAGTWTQVCPVPNRVLSPQVCSASQRQNIARWKVEGQTMIPSSIYRLRTKPDSSKGQKCQERKQSLQAPSEDILCSPNGDRTWK